MAKVKVLIQGYAKKYKNGWKASSTCVLIQDKGLNILVDPGTNKKLLLTNLKKSGLRPKDIDLIFLTHYHPDHWLGASLFPDIKILDGDIIYNGDLETGFNKKIPHTDIEVIATPGHAHEHAVLMAKTAEGKVAIAGDLFWWKDEEKQSTDYKSLLNKKDPYTKDRVALIKSRKNILKSADYIIPGHGQVVEVK
ncbi:MAG: MBL fold metallo-hydrolase [Patescibacteria group bacterium]|nr:MBL fold metallo-hydrolase [Patescibacteria group bacterium]MDD5121447.1 MBL fold metallo-hydrolase [Patescibacteria group bacterium]MDD5222176.1 MBL fold metallo-hydrolase [Patescibacteria group bacterium]MDD5396391.1 MBL fold metallo-hydrolase [Patescibacteria group bacterium]